MMFQYFVKVVPTVYRKVDGEVSTFLPVTLSSESLLHFLLIFLMLTVTVDPGVLPGVYQGLCCTVGTWNPQVWNLVKKPG